MYSNLEKLLIKAASCEEFFEEFQVVTALYSSDLNPQLLRTQLQLLKVHLSKIGREKVTILTLKESILSFGESCSLLSEVVKVLSFLLVMPITNATSERSFSALTIKTYLKTTMHRAHLNHLMLLHVHKDIKDRLDLIECANDFLAGSDTSLFGNFVS